MPEEINKKRRQIVHFSLLSGLTMLVKNGVFADGISDLIARAAQNEVIAVRLWPSSIYTRLVIETKNKTDASYQIKEDLPQLIIDIKYVNFNSILQNLSNKVSDEDPVVKSIVVKPIDKYNLRIVVTLKQSIQVQNKLIPPVSLESVNYKYRYVIDMYQAKELDINEALNDDLLALLQLNSDGLDMSDKSISRVKKPNIDTRIQPYPEIKAMPKLANKSNGKILIMLDPGHGGEDPGAIGPSGTMEKDVVLDIAKHLYELINQTEYMQAELTRRQDIFIPLGARVAMARRAHADLFLSIHADAFSNLNAQGSSVFILSDHGASSSFAKWLAKSQNNADLIGGISLRSKDKVVNKVLLDMTQTYTIAKSIKFGQVLLNRIGDINTLHNKHVERAAFAVLKAPDIPSALVETAFISNPREEGLLKEKDFRQKIAYALYGGINNFAKTLLKV